LIIEAQDPKKRPEPPKSHFAHRLENWFYFMVLKIKQLSAIFRAKSQKIKPKSLGILRAFSQRIESTLKTDTFPKRLFGKALGNLENLGSGSYSSAYADSSCFNKKGYQKECNTKKDKNNVRFFQIFNKKRR
jgi:hypothetical protein